jgi:hypothetical protein
MDSLISRERDVISADHMRRHTGHLNVTVEGVRIRMPAESEEHAGFWQWTGTSLIEGVR